VTRLDSNLLSIFFIYLTEIQFIFL
jgi:hypothetical protein